MLRQCCLRNEITGSTAQQTSQYDFFLSTIPAGIDTLSVFNYDGNRGLDNTLFASPTLTGSSPITLAITPRAECA